MLLQTILGEERPLQFIITCYMQIGNKTENQPTKLLNEMTLKNYTGSECDIFQQNYNDKL